MDEELAGSGTVTEGPKPGVVNEDGEPQMDDSKSPNERVSLEKENEIFKEELDKLLDSDQKQREKIVILEETIAKLESDIIGFLAEIDNLTKQLKSEKGKASSFKSKLKKESGGNTKVVEH